VRNEKEFFWLSGWKGALAKFPSHTYSTYLLSLLYELEVLEQDCKYRFDYSEIIQKIKVSSPKRQ